LNWLNCIGQALEWLQFLLSVEFFFEHYHQIAAVKNSIGDFDFIIEFSDRFMEGLEMN
jgi:hypothetical protein